LVFSFVLKKLTLVFFDVFVIVLRETSAPQNFMTEFKDRARAAESRFIYKK